MKCGAFDRGLHVGPRGTVAPCCKWAGERSQFTDEFRTQWRHHQRRLRGGWIPECRDCEQDEREGVTSHRQRINEGALGRRGLVDMKLSTLCNLVCKMCEVKSSSRWFSMVKHTPQFDWHPHQSARGTDTDDLNRNDGNMDHILAHLETADYIKFTGGEPMMQSQVKQLLEHAVTHGWSQRQTLQITTNCTQAWSKDWVSLMDRFRAVQIQCSVDGIERRYEYVRQGATWGTVWHNLCVLRDLCVERPTWQFSIQSLDMAITMAQRLIIPAFYQQHHMPVQLTSCHHPAYYSYRAITEPLRQRYQVRYQVPYDDAQWQLLCRHQSYHDAVWHTDFRVECPELFETRLP